MKFEKGDIIKASNTLPCIVIKLRPEADETYDVYVIDITFNYRDIKFLEEDWNLGDGHPIPKKIGRIHPEFVDLFL